MPIKFPEAENLRNRSELLAQQIYEFLKNRPTPYSVEKISSETGLSKKDVEAGIHHLSVYNKFTPVPWRLDEGKGQLMEIGINGETSYKITTPEDVTKADERFRQVHHMISDFASRYPGKYYSAEEISTATYIPLQEVEHDIGCMQWYLGHGRISSVHKDGVEYYQIEPPDDRHKDTITMLQAHSDAERQKNKKE
jgi:hypothetical protein